jgi:uncharacterized membrane protein
MNLIKDYLGTHEFTNTTTTGRVVSAIGGLAMIGMALTEKKNSTLSKWIKIGSGAVLILRAASGFCPVNKALGVNKETHLN